MSKDTQEPDNTLPYSIVGPYFDALGESAKDDLNRTRASIVLKRVLSSDLLKAFAEIDSVHREICLALNDFRPRPLGFFKMLTVEQLTVALKLYVISWATLLDMLAALINRIFDLGFADRDVTFELVARNKHVQNSELPVIFNKYSKRLDLQKFKDHRNEIVHRGRILDKEIEAANVNRNVMNSKRYSFFQQTHISEDEYKKESSEQAERLSELPLQKSELYDAHYRATLEMVADVLTVLAKTTVVLTKRN